MNTDTGSSRSHNRSFLAALEALRRARLRAEAVARTTQTFLVEAVDGEPVLIAPSERDSQNSPSER